VISSEQPGSITLQRGDKGWGIRELHNYRADMPRIREVLAGLAQAKILENKTTNPAYYERLGVADVAPSGDAEGAAAKGGTLLRLQIDDEQSWSAILGDDASGREGRYVREVGQVQSLLVTFDADVPTRAVQWADSTIIDLPAPDVAEVTITHADGETLKVSKLSADETDFELHAKPDAAQPPSSWTVNALGTLFASLNMEAVQPQDQLDWSDAMELKTVTFSGLQVSAQLLRLDGQSWIRLSSSAPFGSHTEVTGAADSEIARQANAEIAQQVEEINERTKGWAYRVPEYKASAMDKRMADLLTAPAGNAQGGS
jgi:hypothetical protein